MTLRPTAEWTEILRRHRAAYGLPGVAVAVVAGGELVWQGVDGEADPATSRPVTDETTFRAGSITKLLTASGVMILRGRGLLSLDDQAVRHLPELRGTSITIRHLLSHSAGIQREFPDPSREVPSDGRLVEPVDLAGAELLFPPGTVWKYSNFGYAALGEIVRRTTGVPFRAFVTEELLRPLGMARSTFDWTALPAASRAVGHRRVPHEGRVESDPRGDEPASDATGQLAATARDLGRLASLFAGTGRSAPLNRDTVLEMERPVVMVDEGWGAAHGAGPMLLRHGDVVLAGHGGEVGGFAGWVLSWPAEGAGAAALTNVQDAAPLLAMLLAMLDVPRGEHAAAVAAPSPAPPELADLLGEYEGDGSLAAISWREGGLWCEWVREDDLPGPRPAPLTVEGPDLLRFGRGGLYDGEPLEVVRGPGGHVSGFRTCTYDYRRLPRSAPRASA